MHGFSFLPILSSASWLSVLSFFSLSHAELLNQQIVLPIYIFCTEEKIGSKEVEASQHLSERFLFFHQDSCPVFAI